MDAAGFRKQRMNGLLVYANCLQHKMMLYFSSHWSVERCTQHTMQAVDTCINTPHNLAYNKLTIYQIHMLQWRVDLAISPPSLVLSVPHIVSFFSVINLYAAHSGLYGPSQALSPIPQRFHIYIYTRAANHADNNIWIIIQGHNYSPAYSTSHSQSGLSTCRIKFALQHYHYWVRAASR